MFCDIHIRTRRLLIRAFRHEDARWLQPIVADPAVVRYLPEKVMDADATREVLGRLIASYEKNAPGRIVKFTAAVLLSESEELIGWVGLGALDFEPGSIELYYGYGPAHWGHGYATEAAAAMLEFGFDVVGLDRIIGIVHAENTSSRKLLRKLGMRLRGHLGQMPPEHAFFEGLPSFDLTRDSFAAARRGGFTLDRGLAVAAPWCRAPGGRRSSLRRTEPGSTTAM